MSYDKLLPNSVEKEVKKKELGPLNNQELENAKILVSLKHDLLKTPIDKVFPIVTKVKKLAKKKD